MSAIDEALEALRALCRVCRDGSFYSDHDESWNLLSRAEIAVAFIEAQARLS